MLTGGIGEDSDLSCWQRLSIRVRRYRQAIAASTRLPISRSFDGLHPDIERERASDKGAATDPECCRSSEGIQPTCGRSLGDSRGDAPSPIAADPAFVCGHPRHRGDLYHYDQGRTYSRHVIWAAEAASVDDLESAEINAHAADRLLWQYGEACAEDLRDFIAGLATANEQHLQTLGVTVGY